MLNKLNAVALAQYKASGGKSLNAKQLKEVEGDVRDGQARLMEAEKHQIDAQKRNLKALEEELAKIEAAESMPPEE